MYVYLLMIHTACNGAGIIVNEPKNCESRVGIDVYETMEDCEDVITKNMLPDGGIPYSNLFCKRVSDGD
jgi:hypothetical protein